MAWYDGLIGPTPGASDEERAQIARGGLLQAGLGILQANGQPGVSPMQAISGGLLGGLQSAQQGGQQLQQDKFKQMQMDEQQQQIQRRRQLQDLALKFAKPDGTFDMPGYQQALAQIDPQAAMELHQNELRNQLVQAQTQKAMRPETEQVYDGDQVLTQEIGPDGQRKTIATAPRWQKGLGGGMGGSGGGGGGSGSGGGHFGPGAFQVLQDRDGNLFNFNKVTGEKTPIGVVGNNSFRADATDLKNADAVSASDATVDQIQNAIDVAEKLKTSPGIGAGTGLIGTVARGIPGSDAYTFGADLDSFKGTLFLQAIQQLRGTGAITEVEGTKATNAIASVDPKMPKKDVIARMGVAQDVLRQGLKRAKMKQSTVHKVAQDGPTPTASAPQQGVQPQAAPSVGWSIQVDQ